MADEEENENTGHLEVDDKVYAHLDVTVHLKNKVGDPPFTRMKVAFSPDDLPNSIQELTEAYASVIVDALNDRSRVHLVLSDDRNSQLIVELSEVHAIHVHAPDKMPPELLKENNE